MPTRPVPERSTPSPGGHRPAVPPLLSTAVIALLLAVLVLIAPSVGPWQMDARDAGAPPNHTAGTADPPPQEEPQEDDPPETPDPVPSQRPQIPPVWGQVIMGLVITLAAAVTAAVLWMLLRHRRTVRPDHSRTDLQVDPDVAPEEQIPLLSRAARSARQELHTTAEPTDAIIRAWLILEEAAASSGVRRRPADTPTDLTVAVLDRTRADPRATTGMLQLFHRARFGTTAMTGADRQQAIGHLEALARSWDQVRW